MINLSFSQLFYDNTMLKTLQIYVILLISAVFFCIKVNYNKNLHYFLVVIY
ncbi:MAG: hypothetical protein ACI9JR_000649 [Gammaproteobacteria bacterium]|jgi:hypothetical protein